MNYIRFPSPKWNVFSNRSATGKCMFKSGLSLIWMRKCITCEEKYKISEHEKVVWKEYWNKSTPNDIKQFKIPELLRRIQIFSHTPIKSTLIVNNICFHPLKMLKIMLYFASQRIQSGTKVTTHINLSTVFEYWPDKRLYKNA